MKIIIPIMISMLCACSISMRDSLTQDPVYVAYRVSIANRVFPPDRYYTKLNIFYDTKALAYAKNENSFRLRYRKPVIARTDKGLHVDFGLLPSAYFKSPCDITLYFIPLKSGVTAVSGELLTKEFEYHYGPRHKTETRPLEAREITIRQGFAPAGDVSPAFMEYVKRQGIYYTSDTADGDYTKIYIPSHASLDDAVKSFLTVAADNKFTKSGELQIPDGVLYIFYRIEAAGRSVIELRAVFERGKIENNLYLHMFGSMKVREYLEAIDRQFREKVK